MTYYFHLPEKMCCYFPLRTMLCVLCITQSMVYVTSGCIPEEKAALMLIRSSLMEANPQVPDSWGQSDDCCSWYGVKCNKNARVSELELAGSSIYEFSGCWGNLNLSIFSPFHELQLLDLSSNSACLQNLDGLQGLTKLRYLNLSYNIFITNDAMGSLGKLASLEFIHLECTGLFGPLQNIGETLNEFGAFVPLVLVFAVFMVYTHDSFQKSQEIARFVFGLQSIEWKHPGILI
ncbi:unnamed protein product [Urochloa humidicola]